MEGSRQDHPLAVTKACVSNKKPGKYSSRPSSTTVGVVVRASELESANRLGCQRTSPKSRLASSP
eukprot:944319-Amphidinium_carterae.2